MDVRVPHRGLYLPAWQSIIKLSIIMSKSILVLRFPVEFPVPGTNGNRMIRPKTVSAHRATVSAIVEVRHASARMG